MEDNTRNTIKNAMIKIQETIDLLRSIKGKNDEVDQVMDELGYAFADLEYEINQ